MKELCMLLVTSAVVTIALANSQQHDQIPLTYQPDGVHEVCESEYVGMYVKEEHSLPSEWNRAPPTAATGSLIFTTVSSLLQLWPNTVIRPGHTIVPTTMPQGTIMYHGREGDSIPDRSDWLAFDFEHAYMFTDETSSSRRPGFLLTFAATRPLKLVYFDGSSSASVLDGSFDSQDILIYGEVHPDRGWDFDGERIERLCAWAKSYGIDGFVRMQFHFEVMYCDFSDGGFELVNKISVIPYDPTRIYHSLDIEAHLKANTEFSEPPPRGHPVPPKGWIGRLPTHVMEHARIVGKWHDFAPGETRVRIDYSGLVTFYDPAVRSLVAARRGLARPQHRLMNISRAEADMKVSELEEVVSRNTTSGSGVDWGSVTRVVVERYGQRFELLNDTLGSGCYNVTEKAAAVREQVMSMILPYVARADIEARHDNPTSDAWLASIVRRCSTTQTSAIPVDLLTKQEVLIHNAVAETVHEICRRVARAFAIAFDIEMLPGHAISPALARIEGEVHALMNWLDWAAFWVKCRPACAWDETCMFPTWPFLVGEDQDDRTPRCGKIPGV